MEGLKLLVWKNWKTQSRNKIQTLVEILVPTGAALLFLFLRVLTHTDKYPDPITYEAFPLKGNPSAVVRNCSQIYYMPPHPFINQLMEKMDQEFFVKQGLQYNCKEYYAYKYLQGDPKANPILFCKIYQYISCSNTDFIDRDVKNYN